MALPSLDKTWQITPNITAGSGTSRHLAAANLMRLLKDAMKGFSLSPWTVVSSCAKVGGTTWTAGVGDIWTADNEVVWGQSADPDFVVNRAWIVLRQTGVGGGNFQVLFDCLSSANVGEYLKVHFSPNAGFTGGDTTHRPTATDEIYYGDRYVGVSSSYGYGRLHVWMSTDGACTRATYYRSYGQYTWFAAEEPKNPQVGWANPCVVCWQAHGATAGQTYYGDQNSNALYRSEFGSAYLTAEGYLDNPLGLKYSGPDEILPGPPRAFYPMGMASHSAGWRGARKGQLYDLWWFNGSSDRSLIPDDASRQFVVIGDMALPWDGSTAPLWSA